jgi:hypothetical protein
MSKTVLISLAAVVALIVIVVLLGMRYLRTEDEEDFGETAAEHGRPGGRNGNQVRDHHARLRSHHEDHEDERAAGGSGRAGPARRTHGPGMRGAVRAGQDRSWREDSGEMSRAGRPPQRDQHLVKSGGGGRRAYPDTSEAAADRARQGAGSSRSQPGRAVRDGQGERGYADLGGRRDNPDHTGGWDGRDVREARDARAGRENRSGRDNRDARRTRDGWDLSERREPSPAAGLRADADHNGDRRGATGPNARPDARRNGAKPEREALPAVKPRQSRNGQGKSSQGRNKRDSEADWPSTEWDELSDVDYWAELASDKPLTAATPATDASRSRRREPRPEARQGQDARPAQNVLAAEQPERAMVPGAPRATHPIAAAPGSIPADDDPLTSPSFPTIMTEDSRSYRRSRTTGGDARQPASHSGPMPAIGDDYTAPVGRQHADFQQVSRGYPDLPAATASYSVPAGSAGGYPPGVGYLPPAPATTPGHGDSGVRGAYPGPGPGGFLPDAGQVGPVGQHYPSVMPGSGYQATGSYSFPPEAVGYDLRHTEHPGGYQGSEPAPGSLQAREASYPADGYPGGSGAAAHGSLPGGHADPAYPPAYPGPVPGGHMPPYQSPGTQLPGYPDYGPASYDPANAAAQAPERPYAGGDPYGADPYGFPGYGGTGY